ncbi:MAG TPA: ABC transporter ATP-binding protein [Phycicoccus sp.]|nr:ABC transporter ATP-binding protein [Phycicoccus sp.]HQK30445.1 ABC transporter ATP-binding protein [Phycicoccus sp.]
MLTPPFRYDLPVSDLETAPADGDRLLWWLAGRQWLTLLGGVLFGVPWMVAIALQPAAIGRAIDAGIVARDLRGLLLWSAAIAGLGLAIGLLAAARHFFAVRNWLHASFRSSLVADHGTRRAGPALTREVPAGEALTVFTTDFGRMGSAFDVTARFSGALVAFVVVAVILLRASTTLGLVLLVGGPLLISSLTLVMQALSRRQEALRAEFGILSSLGADTVAGLRVLRGIGGEEEFVRRYAVQSGRVRAAGVRLAGVQATLEAAQVLLPGVFVLVVVGMGAHLALRGDISPGQLVAFFGYTTFLTMPLRTAVEFVDRLTSTRVSARRLAKILAVTPDHPDRPAHRRQSSVTKVSSAPGPRSSLVTLDGLGTGEGGALIDPVSGVRIEPGLLTALVSARPEDGAEVLARLGRTSPGRHGVTWGDVVIDDLPIRVVRSHALVAEAHPELFSGPLRDELAPSDEPLDDQALLKAIHVVAGEDILDALPDGLDTEVEERGRSLSGGQRQRLVLARALLVDPEILLLVEPTSAVDAHTEARIIDRLRAARTHRTTVLTTASPLVLDAADEVIHIEGGQATARGTHADLLASHPAYREIVTRGEDQ